MKLPCLAPPINRTPMGGVKEKESPSAPVKLIPGTSVPYHDMVGHSQNRATPAACPGGA